MGVWNLSPPQWYMRLLIEPSRNRVNKCTHQINLTRAADGVQDWFDHLRKISRGESALIKMLNTLIVSRDLDLLYSSISTKDESIALPKNIWGLNFGPFSFGHFSCRPLENPTSLESFNAQ